MFESPWFTRTWVIREVMLCKRLLILIGPLLREPKSTSDDYYLHKRCPQVYQMRKAYQSEYRNSGERKGNMNLRYWRLSDLLRDTHQFGGFVPRDRLYAILPLFEKPIPTILKPDYSKPIREVFTGLSWSLISSDDPDALCHARVFSGWHF